MDTQDLLEKHLTGYDFRDDVLEMHIMDKFATGEEVSDDDMKWIKEELERVRNASDTDLAKILAESMEFKLVKESLAGASGLTISESTKTVYLTCKGSGVDVILGFVQDSADAKPIISSIKVNSDLQDQLLDDYTDLVNQLVQKFIHKHVNNWDELKDKSNFEFNHNARTGLPVFKLLQADPTQFGTYIEFK